MAAAAEPLAAVAEPLAVAVAEALAAVAAEAPTRGYCVWCWGCRGGGRSVMAWAYSCRMEWGLRWWRLVRAWMRRALAEMMRLGS